MSIRLNVVDRTGEAHEVDTPAQGSLMEALRELEYGVSAICGGMCSCATCHVYIAPEWAGKLPDRQSDELDLLSELQFRQQTSRLSCQVRLTDALDGLSVTLAPEE
ncbi:MAG: 2Fe-2S iron-sulfur cluster-binding protein [Steroidobacter sp.]